MQDQPPVVESTDMGNNGLAGVCGWFLFGFCLADALTPDVIIVETQPKHPIADVNIAPSLVHMRL